MPWQDTLKKVMDEWDKRYVVISPDVDGMLSALLLSHKYGTKIIGVYTTRHIVLFDNHDEEDAKKALWVDHDINHPEILCVGQHLIQGTCTDQIPTRRRPTFNPNLEWSVGADTCFNGRNNPKPDKYPYATIHFLLKGLEVPEPQPNTTAFCLLAHADGTMVVSYDYLPNCTIWKNRMFPNSPFIQSLVNQSYATPQHLVLHQDIVDTLLRLGVNPRRAAAQDSPNLPAAWRFVQGNQGVTFARRRNNPIGAFNRTLSRFNNVLQYLSDAMSWETDLPTECTSFISGDFEKIYPNQVTDLDTFLVQQNVFSHAYVFQSALNYTTNITL
jgi:hypothetical protein